MAGALRLNSAVRLESHPLEGSGRQQYWDSDPCKALLCADFSKSHSVLHKSLCLATVSSIYALLDFVQTVEAIFVVLGALIKIRVHFLNFLT